MQDQRRLQLGPQRSKLGLRGTQARVGRGQLGFGVGDSIRGRSRCRCSGVAGRSGCGVGGLRLCLSRSQVGLECLELLVGFGLGQRDLRGVRGLQLLHGRLDSLMRRLGLSELRRQRRDLLSVCCGAVVRGSWCFRRRRLSGRSRRSRSRVRFQLLDLLDELFVFLLYAREVRGDLLDVLVERLFLLLEQRELLAKAGDFRDGRRGGCTIGALRRATAAAARGGGGRGRLRESVRSRQLLPQLFHLALGAALALLPHLHFALDEHHLLREVIRTLQRVRGGGLGAPQLLVQTSRRSLRAALGGLQCVDRSGGARDLALQRSDLSVQLRLGLLLRGALSNQIGLGLQAHSAARKGNRTQQREHFFSSSLACAVSSLAMRSLGCLRSRVLAAAAPSLTLSSFALV